MLCNTVVLRIETYHCIFEVLNIEKWSIKNLEEFNLEMLLIEYHCKYVSDFSVYIHIIVNYGNYQFNVRRYYKPPK